MKKIYIALAVVAAALLVSCVQEKSFNDAMIGENSIVFSLQNTPSTRGAEDAAPVKTGVKFELASAENGRSIFMEETVQDLNNASIATKGTPAYTENVGKLYENMGVVIKNGDNVLLNTTGFYAMDDEMVGGGWRYQGEFSNAAWTGDTALDFYFWMPVANNGITGTPTYATTGQGANRKQTISFSYETPGTAEAQKDLIFAARPLSRNQHDQALPNGAPVLFNHALTAVKFAIANYSDVDHDNITIKSISFKGLVGKGSCVITPQSENNYRDNKTNYSSSAANVVVWTPAANSTSATYTSGEFGAPVEFKNKANGGGSFNTNGDYPDSFAAAGNEDNLNNTDASQTFWLIPQDMNDDIKLTITYVYAGKESTGDLDFGKALSGVKWKAGELRTYTIKVDDVNVKIEDSVDPIMRENETLVSLITGNPILDEDGQEHKFTYYGGTKSNIIITNTGNTDAYIRAALIGQWLDDDGNPVFGFTDYTAGRVVLVDSWYQDQFVSENGKHGYFVDLPGYHNGNKNTTYTNPLHNWYLHTDGYYYYKNIVPAGQRISAEDPLFTSYTVDMNPAVVVAGEVRDVYFTLEIAIQGVSAKKSDGTDYSLSQAWNAAGVTVTAQ